MTSDSYNGETVRLGVEASLGGVCTENERISGRERWDVGRFKSIPEFH